MDQLYCVKCRGRTETTDIQNVVSRNGRPMIRGICVVCGKKKTQFVKKSEGGDLINTLNAVTSDIKLPWATFFGELHLPGHSFTGPGTKLNLRLNPDDTPRDWSKPVTRVDEAAYAHDLAYAKHSDTASRIAADRVMLKNR